MKFEGLMHRLKRHSFLTIEDNRSIDIEYCAEVMKFEEEQIVLRLAKSYVRIIGTELSMRNYAYDNVKISGKIYSVTFEEQIDSKRI